MVSTLSGLGGCGIFRSARLPPDLAELNDLSERIDFEYGPPPVGVPAFASRGSGQVQIQQLNIRTNFHFDRDGFAIPSISITERGKVLTELQCYWHGGCLMSVGGSCYEECDCKDKARHWEFRVDVSNGVSFTVLKDNLTILKTAVRRARVIAPNGSAVTTLYRTESEVDPLTNLASLGEPVAAASTSSREISLFIPRRGNLRVPALVAFLIALVVKPPYVQSWAYYYRDRRR
jgi:hypothetical protein